MKMLEDKSDFLRTVSRQFALAQRPHIHAIDDGAAARRPVQAAENIDQRCLARTRRAHDGDPFPG